MKAIERIEENEANMKSVKLMKIAGRHIVQFTDFAVRERSATAFCANLAIAYRTYDLVLEREFPAVIPAAAELAVA